MLNADSREIGGQTTTVSALSESIHKEMRNDALSKSNSMGGILMVGGVVLNHDGSLATISPGQLFDEGEVSAGIEDAVLSIIESGAPEFDGPENLHALALSANRNFWRAAHAAPGRVQSRVLPETLYPGCPPAEATAIAAHTAARG